MREYKSFPTTQEFIIKFICNKCGKIYDCEKVEYMTDLIHNFELSFGYASEFDGETWHFDLCENCIKEIVNTFKVPIEKDN